jgi:dolichol kinase
MRRELGRKAIHLATIAVPLAAWWLPRPVTILVLVLAVLLAGLIEVARFRLRWVRYLFLSRTRSMLRSHERAKFAGATYLAIAYLLAVVLFPKPVAVAAMLYSGAGDAVAALVGKRWGRHRTDWGKSWEGAAAGLVANVAAGLAIPGLPLAAVACGAIVAAALEFSPVPVDDNLLVTLGGGAAAWLGWLLVAPTIPV